MRILIPKSILQALVTVTGIVFVWRGIWLILDAVDITLFGGSHALTGFLGVIVGIAILYFPDHDLKELGKL